MKTLILLLLVVIGNGAELNNANTAIIPDWVTIATYEITGVSGNELRSQIDRFGPFDSQGLRHDAYTTWTIRWVIPAEKSGKSPVEGIVIDLKAIVVLPKLKAENKISDKLASEWDNYIVKLKEHEAKHIRISENCIAEMKEKLKTFRGTDVNAVLNAIVVKYRQLEIDMDSKCDHGRRDGVKFY